MVFDYLDEALHINEENVYFVGFLDTHNDVLNIYNIKESNHSLIIFITSFF